MRCLRASVLLVLLTAGCGERIQNTPPPGTSFDVCVTWQVHTPDSLTAAYSAIQPPPPGRLVGFASRRGDAHTIHTLAPTRVDDDAVTTLGHEFLHVVLGEYHQ